MRGRKMHMDTRSPHPRGVLNLVSCIRLILLLALLSPLCHAQFESTPNGLITARPPQPTSNDSPPPMSAFSGNPGDSDENNIPTGAPSLTPPSTPPGGPPSPLLSAPSPSLSPPSPSSRGGLTSGAKAGLGLISVAGLLQVAVFFYLMARRRQLLRDLNDPGDWSPARDL